MNVNVDLKKEFQKFESDLHYFHTFKQSIESLEKDLNSVKQNEFIQFEIRYSGREKNHTISLSFSGMEKDQDELKNWLKQTIIAKINGDLAEEKIHMQSLAESIKKYLEIK
ncbi:hypothetical protein [Limnobacter sp.]|uniref:hypothetical protein n=1 Tax=Limnobacter sp. TaxID=2003368 RepID=UPI0025C12E6B|nr:hypothetical protein [Limnobacter sp.]